MLTVIPLQVRKEALSTKNAGMVMVNIHLLRMQTMISLLVVVIVTV